MKSAPRLPVARPAPADAADDRPLFLTGRERTHAIAVVEELDLLLKTKGVAVARGSLCALVLELARVAHGKAAVLVVLGLWT